MLLLTEFKIKKTAVSLARVLLAKKIHCEVKAHDEEFEVWVERRVQLEEAQEILERFLQNPTADEFKVKLVDTKRQKTRAIKASYRKNFSRQYHLPLLSRSLILISIVVYILQQSMPGVEQHLMILPVWGRVIAATRFQAFLQYCLSEPWRLVTPIFLHFSILHILFNCWWIYELGGLIEKKEKPLFFVTLVLLSAIGSNCLQYFVTGVSAFGGLSGVVYALFGYLWIMAKYNPMSGYWLRQDIVVWMLGWMALGFFGYFNMANYGHLGGLLMGVLFAYIKTFVRSR
jgi:GlpG protein